MDELNPRTEGHKVQALKCKVEIYADKPAEERGGASPPGPPPLEEQVAELKKRVDWLEEQVGELLALQRR